MLDSDILARRVTGTALVLLLIAIFVGAVFGAEPRFWTLDRRQAAKPSRSKSLADIQSRYVTQKAFPDPATAAHEMTHFINGDISNWASRSGPRMTGHYCLEGRVAIIPEVDVSLAEVARLVPESLRDYRYRNYLFNGQDPVDAVVEEWSCYLNDAAVTRELGITNTDIPYSTVEVGIYATCVPWASRSDDPDLKALLAWQWKRAMELSSDCKQSAAHLEKLRASPDAAALREFCTDYFGEKWTLSTLGF